jgi:hypothetical protein
MGEGCFCSVRVGLFYRAPGLPVDGGVHWFWIGTHGEYDKVIGQLPRGQPTRPSVSRIDHTT